MTARVFHIPVLVVVLACVRSASAETVVAIDGEVYHGDVSVTAHAVKCVSPEFNRTLSLGVVREILLTPGERIEFEKRRRAVRPLDAEGHFELGMWLKSKHQHLEAQEYFRKTVTIDPEHVNARRELGFVKPQNAWTYSPALYHRMMYDWVGTQTAAFHLKLAKELKAAGDEALMEKELRRVLAVDPVNIEAVDLIRPVVAKYKLKNRYRLPFEGTWQVISGPTGWGHRRYSFMMNAWDFRRVDEKGSLWAGPPTKVENHLTWNQPVFAPADGVVYENRQEFPDNPLGVVRPLKEGNRILIRHAHDERTVIGHLKQNSVPLKVGDKVKQGQLVGYLGNSGRSSTPHIHFAIFDADGVSLPAVFDDFRVKTPDGFEAVESGTLTVGRTYDNAFQKKP